mmetsp:Transcript_15828/g.43788  ORF Transcript_15828/g.43788 Transcript_15828/m.43788 type:complete len:425 (-) Transcript_15828:1921-3195(-)
MSEESRLLLEEESRVRRILFGTKGRKANNKNSNGNNNNKNTRKLNEVPDYLRKRRRIAVEQGRGRDMTATSEDRERQAVLEEAVEATEHDIEAFRATAEDVLRQERQQEQERKQEQDEEDNMYNTMFRPSFIEEPRVVIRSSTGIGRTGAGLVLADLDPDYIVLYDFDVAFVRAVEIFAAMNPRNKKEDRLKVYFLMFAASSEQKVFLKALEREQAAFEKLIYHKKTMPPPVLQVDGTTQELQQALAAGGGLGVAGTYANGTLPLSMDTRRKAGGAKGEKRDIAVDVREFRSALPSILHRGGMRLAPVTLLVGDFVLSNVHCVERKSISDLFGSFASGRLCVNHFLLGTVKVFCFFVCVVFRAGSECVSRSEGEVRSLSKATSHRFLTLVIFCSLANDLVLFRNSTTDTTRRNKCRNTMLVRVF